MRKSVAKGMLWVGGMWLGLFIVLGGTDLNYWTILISVFQPNPYGSLHDRLIVMFFYVSPLVLLFCGIVFYPYRSGSQVVDPLSEVPSDNVWPPPPTRPT